nr:ribonuclease H-like domain-containing protein [Tanacetum cinerariifolium]
MANLSKDIQCASSNTRPPMLDRTDFASWQQHIRLYCRGKENGVNILKSIDEGQFQMGIVRETLVEGTEGAPHLGPKRPRVYSDHSPEEKDRNQATVQDDRVMVQNVQGRLNRGQRNNLQGGGVAGQDVVDASLREWDLALNVDNVFQADDCDAFDSDGDEAPTAQTMFMANLSFADLVYDEVGSSYDSDILSEVHDHDHYQDAVCEHHEEHKMHDNVQLNYVVDLHADYMSDSNMIPYDQHVKDNAVPGVQSNVSSVPNDAYMMIYNDMYEPHAQYVSKTSRNTVVDNSLTAELATYKEQVELYERWARFELTEREQKIDEKLRIVITDRNFKEETLKRELHSVKLQLASTINHNKLMSQDLIKMKTEALKEQTTASRPIKALTVFIKDHVKPTVLAPGKFAIDVKPIPPRLRNNRENHIDYLKHLKESVEIIREIVEEAKVVRPLDRVNRFTDASGSQPRSNTKKNRISPAKGVNKMKVEEHPRTNKSHLRTMKHVDSSSRSKRTVIEPPSMHNSFNVVRKVKQVWKPKHDKVTFRKHSCYVRDMDGVELIKGSRGFNLYTISVEDMIKSSPICLLSKASKNKSWLWHRCLNHLNFGTINDLARKDLVQGLPRLKFEKDHLCFACQLGKSKKHTHKHKIENTNLEVLNTLHIDLYGPMRMQIINRKKYILVIVDDYSRFTWVKFLKSKDETPEVVINFLQQIQVGLNKTVRYIRTNNGTKFVNKGLSEYYEHVGIFTKRQFPGLVPNPVPAAPYVPPTNKDLEILFQLMFDEYMEPPRVERPVSPTPSVQVLVKSANTPSSTTIDQDAPSPSHSPSSSAL